MNVMSLIGNCQTVTLCFYLQQLLSPANYSVNWLMYGNDFRQHLGKWSYKCNNKILDYDVIISKIKESDVIIYQEISSYISNFSRTDVLKTLAKPSCKMIKIPSMWFNYSQFEDSMDEIKKRENSLNVDIKFSTIVEKFPGKKLMLTVNHPNTFLFLEFLKEITTTLNLTFFSKEQIDYFLKDDNFMHLPPYIPQIITQN